MVEMELPKNPTRKQTKQPISVPFLWEIRPGIPKEDWEPPATQTLKPLPLPPTSPLPPHHFKPSRPPPPPPPHRPPELIASVPFQWDEKPEKPVPSFPSPTTEFGTHSRLGEPIPSGQTSPPQDVDGDENESGGEKRSMDEQEMILETFNFQTDESFNSESLSPHTPIKLSRSISLEWEERPEKPLPSSPLPTREFEVHSSPKPKHFALPPPPVYFRDNEDDESDGGDEHGSQDRGETISELYFETFSFKTDESFNSVPSLLANRPEPPPLHLPMKLTASIPFKWEEKPGKPIPNFLLPTPESKSNPLPQNRTLLGFTSPAVHSQEDDNNKKDYGDENRSRDEGATVSESELETISFKSEESFNSIPFLLANCLMPTAIISNAVPVMETPPSPQGYGSDSSTSSYATTTTSLVGAPFLERLFPLLSPKLDSTQKFGCPEKKSIDDHRAKVQSDHSDCLSTHSVATRRPMTLGELIMMSRRRSSKVSAKH